jgi:hypothetical protein
VQVFQAAHFGRPFSIYGSENETENGLSAKLGLQELRDENKTQRGKN